MRNAIRSFAVRMDVGLVVALFLGCIAAWPFFQHVGLPQANDAELHIYRIAELGYSLRSGNFYPRWAPDFYHGHGYPIFNYYSPLIYHLGNWLTLFRPENAVVGAKLLFILSHVLGAIGAYLLGREFGGQSGGVLGSAAFTFSPYILLINPHIRGDLAEVFAVSLIPWALWGWERLWRKGDKASFGAAVITAACVLLSHNLTGLTLLLLLCPLSLFKLFSSDCKNWRRTLLAGLLVAALTAYFWLPFLLERSYIKLEVAGDGHYDFREHFVLLRDLLAFVPLFDWRSTSMQSPMSAGPLMLFFACLGIILSIRRGALRHLLFYIVGAGICFWLITYNSQWVWEKVPGIAFYQFPWRFLGPLAALLVPLISSAHLPQKWVRAFVPIALVMIMASALPALYPIPWESDRKPITPTRYIEIELEGRWRGTTSTNDFVPVYVDMIPGPQPSVIASYEQALVDRVNRHTLPEGTSVEVIRDVPWNNHFRVQTPQQFVLRLYLFYFPGWKAYIDGKETSVSVAHPEGFVTLVVPEGEHDVRVKFEDTPPRRAGWVIALLSSLVLGVAIWRLPRTQVRTSKISYDPESSNVASRRALLAILVFAVCKGIILDNTGWLHYNSPLETALAAHYQQQANFGGEIGLLGYDLSSEHLKAGQILDVTLYWNAQRPMTQTYQSFVQLISSEGIVGSQSDHLNPAGFPTNLWPTDRYIGDKHRLTLPVELPPGDYRLFVGLYLLQDDLRRLSVIEAGGTETDHLILSQTISVK